MFGGYLVELEKQLQKLCQVKETAAKKTAKTATKTAKTAKKAPAADKKAREAIIEAFTGLTPSDLQLVCAPVADKSGYVANPDGFLLVRKVFKEVAQIFREGIPEEIVRGVFHFCPVVNRKNLLDTLENVSSIKKVGRYVEERTAPAFVPSFVIAIDSTYSMKEIKESVIELYGAEDHDTSEEFDIMYVLGKGLVIKDWRNRGNFVALETGADSLKWFFVLMNEYLAPAALDTLDVRSYINDSTRYNEY